MGISSGGSLGLTNAVQGFLMSQANVKAQKQQDLTNQLASQMLMGQATPEQQQQLAQTNPQVFMGLQQQQQAKQAQIDAQQREEMVNQLFSAAVSGDANAMAQLAQYDSNKYKDAIDIQNKQKEIERGRFAQATGSDMQGYVFDKETGTFSMNPELFGKISNNIKDKNLTTSQIQSLNKDFTNLLSQPKMIYNTAKDLESLSAMDSGPASISMVFKFMKALDPTSVVREGEFSTAEGSSGVPEKLKNYFNKMLTGDALGEVAKRDFIITAKTLANNAVDAADSEFSLLLDTYGENLNDGFKNSILKRIPSKFEIEEPIDSMSTAAQQPAQQQYIPPVTGNSVNWSDL